MNIIHHYLSVAQRNFAASNGNLRSVSPRGILSGNEPA